MLAIRSRAGDTIELYQPICWERSQKIWMIGLNAIRSMDQSVLLLLANSFGYLKIS